MDKQFNLDWIQECVNKNRARKIGGLKFNQKKCTPANGFELIFLNALGLLRIHRQGHSILKN